MAITVTNRNYSTRNHPTGNDFLLANEGQIVTESIDFTVDFDFESTSDLSTQITSEYDIKLLGENWEDQGYTIGDSITITGAYINTTPIIINLTTTITDLQSDTMTVADSLGASAVSQLFPNAPANTVMGITNNTRTSPQSVELFHNLVLNSSQGSKNSLLDGEVNRFIVNSVDSMAVNDTLPMEQLGDKSGGSYLSAELTRNTDVSSNRAYTIELEYDIPYKFEDTDFDEPSYFAGLESLKPFYEINCLPETNNPNSALTISYDYFQGNVGWYNENYNQGVNDFTSTIDFSDTSGNTINEIDYNQDTIVTIDITGTNPIVQKAEVQVYLIPPISTVKNNSERNADNIYLCSFFANFDGVSVVETNNFGKNGANFTTSNHAVVSSSNSVQIVFTISPNAVLTSVVENMQPNERLYRVTANIEESGGTTNNNNAVSIIARQSTLDKAEVIGGIYPANSLFYNHAQNITTGTGEIIYNGCTEDDFMYVSTLDLNKSDSWKTLNLNVQVERLSDGAAFDLLTKSINLSQYVVSPDGTQNINYLENFTQYLEADERNKLEVKLTGTSTASTYEVQIIWSLLANWRYWVAQNNAFTDFFDVNIPNNGMNAEWVRYLELAGYNLRVYNTLVDTNDVSYYFTSKVDLQDYDDEPTVTSTIVYLDDTGAVQTSLVAGQEMIVRADHVLSSGTWDTMDTWGWVSERPREAEPNKRISSEWDWTSQNSPLKPKTGQTKAELTFPSPNTARLECIIDTNIINTGDYSIISRIESPKAPECIGVWDYVFDFIEAYSSSESQYLGALDQLMTWGNNATKSNICCPTCTADINGDGTQVEVWAFGNEVVVDGYISSWSSGEPCCRDVYQTFDTCESDFDTTIDSIMAILDGDTELLLDRSPTQINAYGTTLVTQLLNRLTSLTTDEAIRYAIMYQLLNFGLKFTCDEDGNKFIGSIVTPYVPSTQSMYKWTENGVTKFTEIGQPKSIE